MPAACAATKRIKSLLHVLPLAGCDPASPGGWKIDLGPFPGWREVPTW
jgi:hypothetical protein